MSDMAEFQGSSKVDLEGDAQGVEAFRSPADPAASSDSASASDEASSESANSKVYGPAPKPVAQPAIFKRIHQSEASEPTAQQVDIPANSAERAMTEAAAIPRTASPSFCISSQRDVSDNMMAGTGVSGSMISDTMARSAQGGVGQAVEDIAAEAGETVTISVKSQCDGPSLNEIVEIDVADASREELMAYHSELMGWIRELEFALQDCQSDFQSHLQQYAQQEQLLERRTRELVTLQERYNTLGQEIDAQQKAHQRQTILVETLQGQLDSSQERVAQMERDFSQVQRRCSDQAQQLLQAEGLCRDLKSRLSRQQRHTMQFKAALEKSLAVSVSDSDYDLGDLDLESMDSSGELFPRPKPVRPWSDQLDAAAVSQALSGLEQPSQPQQSGGPGVSGAASKGANLQLAFETPEDAATAASGNAVMGLVAPGAIANNQPTEPVFDPVKAEDLEAQLQQESESILKGNLLGGSSAGHRSENSPSSSHTVTGTGKVAFVPPIKPLLPEEQAKQIEAVTGFFIASATESPTTATAAAEPTAPATEPASKTTSVSTVTVESDKAAVSAKPTTLAGIDLPCFPKF